MTPVPWGHGDSGLGADVVLQVLTAAVREITGDPDATGRPSQIDLTLDVTAAISTSGGQSTGRAPVGSGKSFALLAPAMVCAALDGRRTVISTESLSLQNQILVKDAPVVERATKQVTGEDVTTAVLKGWGNYACFGPDVEVLTIEGPRRIVDLVGQDVTLLDGAGKWVSAPIKSFGEQEIVELEVRRGNGTATRTIETTAEHRWFVQRDANYSQTEERLTIDLRPGDALAYQGSHNRTLGRMRPCPTGIAHGLVFGDGSRFRSTDNGRHPGACTIALHGRKNWALQRYFPGYRAEMSVVPQDGHAENHVRVTGLPSFFKEAPRLDTNARYLYGWLAGYFAADGTVNEYGAPSISSARRANLELVQQVCTRLGIDVGPITRYDRVGMARDGEPRPLYRLSIEAASLAPKFFLVEQHRARFEARMQRSKQRRVRRRWKVVSVRRTGVVREVYCASVPSTASFTLAGNILTGNCTVRSLDAARALAASTGAPPPASDEPAAWADVLERVPPRGRGKGATTVVLDEQTLPRRELRDLLVWALRAVAAEQIVDRAAYTGPVTDQMWQAISVSRNECVGDSCPLYEACVAVRARQLVSEADVIVTNHSLLAIQAANSAPVVVGNRSIGPVHHVMVDEAHALAATVRSQGAGEVSGRRVRSAAGAVGALLDTSDRSVQTLTDDGRHVADLVESHLNRGCKAGQTVDANGDVDPLGGIGESISAWVGAATRMIGSATQAAGPGAQVKAKRVLSRLGSLRDAVDAVTGDDEGVARWVERDSDPMSAAVAKSSPVDVAALVAGNLWTAEVPVGDDGEPLIGELDIVPDPEGDGPGTYALSVVAVSGTLQPGAPRELGMRGKTRHHSSPLVDAYQRSMLLVPKPTPAEIDVISTSTGRAGKRRLSMREHAAWATRHAVDLVEAAGGRALVLSATSAGGQVMAAALRASAGRRWRVLSQWDGENVAQVVQSWRGDESAVLVGTRSLMTGTDAPGMTNVLTILDRVPRAPQNPVDEARADLVATRLACSVWQARDEVYARDAALRLEQAAGRLIRSASDVGVVAVLDPRLLKSTPLAYAESTRRIYMGALAEFTTKSSSPGEAVRFLTGLVDARGAAA